MNFLLFILLFCVCVRAKGYSKYLDEIPGSRYHLTKSFTNFGGCQNSSIQELQCQVHSQDIDVDTDEVILVNLKIMHKAPQIARDGYVCTGVTYHHSCDVNFVGMEKTAKWKTSKDITKTECSVAIEKYLSGTLLVPEYPDRECYWMKDKRKSREYITVVPHQFVYDLIKDKVEDPLVTGICDKGLYCSTQKSYQQVQFEHELKIDPSDHYFDDVGFFDSANKQIHSTLLGTINTKKLTTFHMFGMTWYQEADSLAFSTEYHFTDETLKESSQTHNIQNSVAASQLLDVKSRALMEAKLCSQLLPTIKVIEQISSQQLELLAPQIEGRGFLYIISGEDQNLYECSGRFEAVDSGTPISAEIIAKLSNLFGDKFYTSLGIVDKGKMTPYSRSLYSLEDHVISKDIAKKWESSQLNFHYQDLGLKETSEVISDKEVVKNNNMPDFPGWEYVKTQMKSFLLQVCFVLILIIILYFMCSPKRSTRTISI